MAYINGKKVLGVVRTVGTGTGELPTDPSFDSVLVKNEVKVGMSQEIELIGGQGAKVRVSESFVEDKTEIDAFKVATNKLKLTGKADTTLMEYGDKEILYYDGDQSEANGTFHFGNAESDAVIKSKNKPYWYDGKDYKELAIKEEIGTGGGSLPTNPEFETVKTHEITFVGAEDEHTATINYDSSDNIIYTDINTIVRINKDFQVAKNLTAESIGANSVSAKQLRNVEDIQNFNGGEIVCYEEDNSYGTTGVTCFGDMTEQTIIRSAKKPLWTNGEKEVELATMDDIGTGGGSLPTDPEFNSVKVNDSNTNSQVRYGGYYISHGNNSEHNIILLGQQLGSNAITLGNKEEELYLFSKSRPKVLIEGVVYPPKEMAFLDDIDKKIQESLGLPINIATASAMDAVLVSANVGKVYKYIGTTTDKYTNGNLYLVEEE